MAPSDLPLATQPVTSSANELGSGDEIDLEADEEKVAAPTAAAAPAATSVSEETTGSAFLPASVEVRPIQASNQRVSVVANPLSEPQSLEPVIEISVEEPRKVGDGYGSYIVYRVKTKTSLPFFRRNSFSVSRRFSDFRGLRDKLAEKHVNSGRIVPPAPEKDAVGTAKVKMSKDDDVVNDDFIEKRRIALERYLNRTAAHPVLRADPDFREFLELDTELPKSTSSSALSGAGVRRLLNRFGDTVNKMTFKMEEADSVSIEQTIRPSSR